ncbi:glycosyl transferase [Candidatus Beckwithbacteria bacterium CG23_combo_of_CG06-09_8_20_14_all_34_8]|uniref:Glycosyl transferase n=1 Tax=Candidatus Beckwithbacteria bacterium CG23_combo_of_CG06-09_8_20_14_all_34_8 TaxID=1974497 RepID=A0A2H0B5W3_9BACT|nr:MAG: glycosyl transferase [Candidatus Beckwithbacteria bacterium CG23_combo_of_CG06-09_8_20_14_all_34_8]
MTKLSILIPVYNEKNTIIEIINQIKKSWKEAEIIIVDDASSDGTQKILAKINDPKIKIFYHQKNQGKGAALKTAIAYASGKITIIQDADLEYDPKDYKSLIIPIEAGKAEVVYGSRFLGPHRNLLFWHMVGNKFINLFANVLYNTTLSDLETCYKVFKTDLLKSIDWKAKRFDFETEITAKILKKHLYIYEVPISYAGRDYSQGKKIGAKDFFHALWSLLKYRFVS